MGRSYTRRAVPDRDWCETVLELKARLDLTDVQLAHRIGIPESTLLNLKSCVVAQPLHSTGEKILALYRATFPEK